ncbi:uncharacterized protein LOC134223800 isoform X2 [Armigeres subalbatus]|uniref:uncharacterized protein LOC134223800 isoform X2 n=1 Tax=Armigeres subalbatus TaxID=124917 RepID=UPI002ED1B015
MQSEIKVEPWDEAPLEVAFHDVGCYSKTDPIDYEKRPLSADMGSGFRFPDAMGSADAMNYLLQLWGLEALSDRFAEHLIDLTVLDYILDVDIIDLCRDMPIRYRLVLRHNLKNGNHKHVNIVEQLNKRPRQAIIPSVRNADIASNTNGPKKKRKKTMSQAAVSEGAKSTLDPMQIVSIEDGESIRSILSKDPKFKPVLNHLDAGGVPDVAGLRHLNRLVTNHYFEERILEHSDYPKKEEKRALALKIVEAFPQLEQTRVTPDAPKESYFFWLCAGKVKGPHSGCIEHRATNMRREVPPEQRRFLRREKKPTNYVIPDSIRENASKVASLPQLPINEQTITDGMAECIELHSCILQQSDSDQTGSLLTTFPHLLSYNGKMIQQAFHLLGSSDESFARAGRFLLLGLLLDTNVFNNVENKYIKGTLHIMKKLIITGKKEENEEMSTQEAEAAPLIRWIKAKEGELEYYTVQRHVSERSYLAPHIVCLADVFTEGNMFIVFQGRFIACGKSAAHTLDVFFKLFTVFGTPVPVALRKIHELLMVYLWKVTSACKSITVTKLMAKLNELNTFENDDEYEEADGPS